MALGNRPQIQSRGPWTAPAQQDGDKQIKCCLDPSVPIASHLSLMSHLCVTDESSMCSDSLRNPFMPHPWDLDSSHLTVTLPTAPTFHSPREAMERKRHGPGNKIGKGRAGLRSEASHEEEEGI